jgi:hypothetical protein
MGVKSSIHGDITVASLQFIDLQLGSHLSRILAHRHFDGNRFGEGLAKVWHRIPSPSI